MADHETWWRKARDNMKTTAVVSSPLPSSAAARAMLSPAFVQVATSGALEGHVLPPPIAFPASLHLRDRVNRAGVFGRRGAGNPGAHQSGR